VVIDFSADNRRLSLRVADNGTGFIPDSVSDGHGLLSMRRRAEKLGGHLQIDSASDGTIVTLRVPSQETGAVATGPDWSATVSVALNA
jgi:signal transduction histidine kinase